PRGFENCGHDVAEDTHKSCSSCVLLFAERPLEWLTATKRQPQISRCRTPALQMAPHFRKSCAAACSVGSNPCGELGAQGIRLSREETAPQRGNVPLSPDRRRMFPCARST